MFNKIFNSSFSKNVFNKISFFISSFFKISFLIFVFSFFININITKAETYITLHNLYNAKLTYLLNSENNQLQIESLAKTDNSDCNY